MRLQFKNSLAWKKQLSPSFVQTSGVTCSFVSHCRFGSGRKVRKPGVRPSPSARRGGRTAAGWSTGRRTRSPTSAPPSRSQSPKAKKWKQCNQCGNSLDNPFFFVNHRQRDCSWLCPLFSENDKILTPEDLWNGREVIFLIYSLMYFCQSEERSEHTVP